MRTSRMMVYRGAGSQIVQLYAMCGQSNMRGVGSSEEFPEYLQYIESTNNINIWSTSLFTKIVFGVNNNSADYFGLEASFVNSVYNDTASPVYIVKFGADGTKLNIDGSVSDWNIASTGELYSQFIAKIQAAISYLTTNDIEFEFKGIIYYQGESDTGNTTDASAFSTNLTNFRSQLRTDLSYPNLPFCFVRIHSNYLTASFGNVVRDAIVSVAAADSYSDWVSVDDLDVAPIGGYGHIAGTGHLVLGSRIYDTFN